jgi:hypothetical protein
MQTVVPKISGQWLGHFKYGPEYEDLYGEQVTFSLVLEDLGNGVFQGRCFELEGIGANSTVAIVKGYVENDFIHFVKEYPVDYYFEEDGSMVEYKLPAKPILIYDGQYHHAYKFYTGNWEIETNLGPTVHGDLLSFCTGTWQMSKCLSLE